MPRSSRPHQIINDPIIDPAGDPFLYTPPVAGPEPVYPARRGETAPMMVPQLPQMLGRTVGFYVIIKGLKTGVFYGYW